MLRVVAVFWILCFESGLCSAWTKPSHGDKSSATSEKATKTLSSVRNFEGVIKTVGFLDKMSFWWQNLKDVHYCLCDKKNRPIAFLRSPQDVRKAHQLKKLVHRNVCIKGIPQYINKEPYLLIIVEDVCP
ncbi:MAG: hypothetical protein IJ793_00205 [Opitutales bacterium]|nr:hypothetical protein [Opitutales bacterium]